MAKVRVDTNPMIRISFQKLKNIMEVCHGDIIERS